MLESLHSYAIQLLKVRLPQDVLCLVSGFLNSFTDCPSLYSSSLWNFLSKVSFVVISAPKISERFHDNLLSTTESTNKNRYKTRSHKLFSQENGHIYFWDNLRQYPPYVSEPFPPPLLQLNALLELHMPQIRMSPSVFTSDYKNLQDSLNLHRDQSLGRYLGRPEFVILFFLGATRLLKIVPNLRGSPPFTRYINCNSSQIVVMTPLGNEIFLHGKLKGTDPTSAHALTLAFRETAHVLDLIPLYPLLREHFPNISHASNPSINMLHECIF